MGKVVEFTLDIQPFSQSPRTIWVYLPDSYELNKEKKYDVLYMFDGHNLFFDEVATYGKSWGMKEYLDQNNIDLVVIGQDCNHKGNRRLAEYCPFTPHKTPLEASLPRFRPSGKTTADWFVKVLKPECEKRFRIHSHRDHVGIGGSSMGGLMAEYMITKYNYIFSKAACVSPSHHFCFEDVMSLVSRTVFGPTRIYVDQGSHEVSGKRRFITAVDMMLTLNHAYSEKGCNTYPHITPGGHHCEADWERIVPVFIEYLYPELTVK